MSTATKANWKKASTSTVTLPSGTEVEIRVPNLPAMVKSGVFPNNLISIAINKITEDEVDESKIKELAEYHDFLVSHMLVKPEVAAEDVKDLPAQDVDMLIAIANRERDMDAVGHHLAGLETHEGFRKFRGLDDSDENLLGVPGLG
jgi:hypothetical protein